MWATVLALLSVTAFSEVDGKKALTPEQKNSLTETFGELFVTKLEASFATNTDETLDNGAAAIAALEAKLRSAEASNTSLAAEKLALETEKAAFTKTIADQKSAIGILSSQPEADIPAAVAAIAAPGAWDTANEKHLGGVVAGHMAIDQAHPYNKRAYAALMLAQYGIEMPTPKAAALDYESLKTDLGDYYRIRKQDRIQSFLQSLPSVEKIFPLESGYQDRAVLVNMFLLGDFSQADGTSGTFDNLVKGGYKFEPEELRMFDVMFVTKFNDLKKLEKSWIGYLNREGSSTMKWSFIEYIMVETTRKLQNERELRRISGIRINPTLNVAGTSLGAADGLRQFIKNQINLFKIRPFALGDWAESSISDYIRRGTAMIPEVIRDSGNVVLYTSTTAVTAYHKNNELLYGTNQDYKADIMYVKEYPNVTIVPVPNYGESKRMIWTLKNNITLFEDQPGEMSQFSFEQQDWTLKVWSNWKESVWAFYVGKKWTSLAEIPTDYSTQLIYCNDVDYPVDYYITMDDKDTSPSVSRHTSLVSQANSLPTAITTIDDAVVGKEIRLKCGSLTNAPTIAVAGDFSLLTAPWAPAVDDVLVLKKRSDGKFIELARLNVTSSLSAFVNDDVTPSVLGSDTFVTGANTVATAITMLDDSIALKLYTIYGAGTTYASTIANAGNFVLTAAMTLSLGHSIVLQKSAVNGKFYEISRT